MANRSRNQTSFPYERHTPVYIHRDRRLWWGLAGIAFAGGALFGVAKGTNFIADNDAIDRLQNRQTELVSHLDPEAHEAFDKFKSSGEQNVASRTTLEPAEQVGLSAAIQYSRMQDTIDDESRLGDLATGASVLLGVVESVGLLAMWSSYCMYKRPAVPKQR